MGTQHVQRGLLLLSQTIKGTAQQVFIILCISVPWFTMALPVAYGFIAENARRRFVVGSVAAGVLNIVLNLALIPPTGKTGAAVATTASFVGAAAIWIGVSGRGTRFVLSASALPAIGTLGAVAAIVLPSSAMAIGLGTIAAAASVAGIQFIARFVS